MSKLSLKQDELKLLEFILQNLLRGSNPAMATQSKAFAPLYKKVLTLKRQKASGDE